MAEDAARIASPVRVFKCHNSSVEIIAVFPDGRHIATGAEDKNLWLWDLTEGTVMKKIEKHRKRVRAVVVSRERRLIVSGDVNGGLVAMGWGSDPGKSLTQATQAIEAHSTDIRSLDFSPDGAVLATGSWDKTVKLWNTNTWQLQGYPIKFHDRVYCVRYSPSGELLAIATRNEIHILNPDTRDSIAIFKAHQPEPSGRARRIVTYPMDEGAKLLWTPDGTRLFIAGYSFNNSIREWDPSTWKQVNNPWTGHTDRINAIAVNSAGTLVASASRDKSVRLWQLSDRRTIAIFKHSSGVHSVTFSTDGKRVFSGGNGRILEWAVPEGALPEGGRGSAKAQKFEPTDLQLKILTIDTTARNACITGDFPTAERLLTKEIDADANNSNTYASRSFVMARRRDWDGALNDALESIRIHPSLTGYISKGMAHCGRQELRDAMKAFDLAFMFANADSRIIHSLLLIKAVALFNANEVEEGMQRVQQLVRACPDADTLACHIVEAYFHVELGTRALDDARYSNAPDHFTAAIKAIDCSSQLDIHAIYEDFVVLFGWDLKSLWQSANRKRCHALLCADRPQEAMESYQYMMNMSDETMKASCLDWSINFKRQCSTLYAGHGDAALDASDHDRAIDLYSAAINLGYVNDTVFANRSKAKSKKMLWQEALLDTQKVIELNASSYIGYQLKHAALHGAQRYHEAIEAFQAMLRMLDNDTDMQIRKLRQLYLEPYEAESAIRKVIHAQTENTPLRLLDTTTGLLCDREAQINAFKMSTAFHELLSSTMRHADLRMERIEKVVVIYFRYVTLSHRWEEREPLLHDIQDKVVYQLNAVGGIAKLQAFCEVARRADYRWAWIDTCCIDQHNNAELQQSLNSMFDWYRHSALTIVYLSDVFPPSKSGALAKSAWNTRGWTVPEFLAPKVVLFYQKDWTIYLDDRSPNHKESVTIMQELEEATGIETRSLVAFCPGMGGAREKLQWASTRVTTLPEDIAYSLFGIFGIYLPVFYGEKKQKALGRLLQEVVAESGDISALDWVGESSEFNSCLPADITSYEAPPFAAPSLSEDDIQSTVSSLRNVVPVDLASKLYTLLDTLYAPRFAHCRLRLPCITFPVTEIRRSSTPAQESYFTYEAKAEGLYDPILITTKDKLPQFSRERPTLRTFLLVRPWDRHLMELPDLADDDQSVGDCDPPRSHPPVGSDFHSRALRLIVRLGQPFGAFLLVQQRSKEYKRIASDRDITGRVADMASIQYMMNVETLEIL